MSVKWWLIFWRQLFTWDAIGCATMVGINAGKGNGGLALLFGLLTVFAYLLVTVGWFNQKWVRSIWE